jgi:ribonuclease D
MRIVETNEALADFLGELSSAPYLALDTEFLRDQTYYPRLCLIQVAAPTPDGKGIDGIIDPLAPGLDLAPFYELLKRPDIVKVLHAARQDIEIFYLQGGVLPDPLFDTQVAAMVCGFGDAASYETLARKLAHVEIDKSARFTDWSHRPLSKRQLEYALADVTHLRVIYEKLSAQLARTGREAWVEEEISALKDPGLYRLDPELAWKRLKPRTSNKRFLSLLAALAAWREREAQARDIPREGRGVDGNRRPPARKRGGVGTHSRSAQGVRQFQTGQGPDGGDGNRTEVTTTRGCHPFAPTAQTRAICRRRRSAKDPAPASGRSR